MIEDDQTSLANLYTLVNGDLFAAIRLWVTDLSNFQAYAMSRCPTQVRNVRSLASSKC